MNRLKYIQIVTIVIIIFVCLGIVYMRRDTRENNLSINIDPIYQAKQKTNDVSSFVAFPLPKETAQDISQLNTNSVPPITEANSDPVTYATILSNSIAAAPKGVSISHSTILSNFIAAACSNSPDSVELCEFLELRKTPWNFTNSDWDRIIEILSDTDKTTMDIFNYTILEEIIHRSAPPSLQHINQTADVLLRLADAVPGQTDSLTFETFAATMVALSDKERAIQMLDETTQEMKECENIDSSMYIMACGQKISYMVSEKRYEEAENEYNELFSQKPSDLSEEKWNNQKDFVWFDLMAQYCRVKDNDKIRDKGITALKDLMNDKKASQGLRNAAKSTLERTAIDRLSR